MKIRKSVSSHGNMTTATGAATSSPSSAVASGTNHSGGAIGGSGTNPSTDEKPSTSSSNRRGSSGAASHVLSGFGILKKKSISGERLFYFYVMLCTLCAKIIFIVSMFNDLSLYSIFSGSPQTFNQQC